MLQIFAAIPQFSNIGGLGISFRRNEFWELLGGQALLVALNTDYFLFLFYCLRLLLNNE